MDMSKGFQPNGLLAIRFVFAVCLELILFNVFIIYFWGFLRVDHVVLCSVQGIGNTAGLEGFDDHLFGYLCPYFLDPPEDKISAWCLLLPSWGKQTFQPLLRRNREALLAPKVLRRAPTVRASRGVWGHAPPPGNFANLVSLKWHFQHFDIIFVVFFKVLDSEKMD